MTCSLKPDWKRCWWENFYSIDVIFPFVASFTEKSIGLVASFDLNRLSVHCTGKCNSVLVHHRKVRMVERAVLKLHSRSEEFKPVFQEVFASQCKYGLYSLRLYPLDRAVKRLCLGAAVLPPSNQRKKSNERQLKSSKL